VASRPAKSASGPDTVGPADGSGRTEGGRGSGL